jgi:CRP-like cAMP-binding protein
MSGTPTLPDDATSRDAAVEILATHPIFGGLGTEELERLLELGEVRELPRGELVFREGEPGRELFIVLEGRVEVVARLDTDQQRTLATLGAGDCFGEMSLIDIQRRSASVIATEASRFLVLSTRAFRDLQTWRLESYTLIVLNIAREISRRLRKADARIVELGIQGGAASARHRGQ